MGRSLNPQVSSQAGITTTRLPENKRKTSYAPAPEVAARAESHPIVRAKMQEKVLSTLRRTSLLATIILICLGLYDYFKWRGSYVVRSYSEAMYFVLLIRIAGMLPTAGGAACVLYFVPLKEAQMQASPFCIPTPHEPAALQSISVLQSPVLCYARTIRISHSRSTRQLPPHIMLTSATYFPSQVVNLLLIMGPFITTTAILFFSPERDQQYIMCLTLFQVCDTSLWHFFSHVYPLLDPT